MRKLAGTLSRFDTSAIFINQLREKIGVMFGSPETTPGGRALKFYSSVRLDVRKIENLKDGTDVVGSRTRVKVVKNKVAPPFRQCEFDIMYGKGISKEGSLIDVGVDLEIIKKAGAWFTYEGEQLGQGRENARQFLAEHTDVRDEIERKVREAVGLTEFGVEGDETPDRDRPRRRARRRARSRSRRRQGQGKAEGPQTATASAVPSGHRRRGTSPTNPQDCHERALGLLAVRPRSRRELERRLLAGGVRARPRSTTCSCRLERVGLIDDEAFARQMADYQFGSRAGGPSGGHRAPCMAEGHRSRRHRGQVVDEAPDDEDERAPTRSPRSRAAPSGRARAGQGLHPPHIACWSDADTARTSPARPPGAASAGRPGRRD